MEAYEVSAFTRNGQGGNLAGVVIMDEVLSEIAMQELANKFGYSETAFVEVFNDNYFNVRFFTPIMELDLCGHATIATFHTLKEKGYLQQREAYQYTKAGKLKVICQDNFLMEMSAPKLLMDVDKKQAADLLGIKEIDIINVPRIIEVGVADTMVFVKSCNILNQIEIRKQEMSDFSKQTNTTGFHVATIENNKYYVRNFAPICGIDEESATGTANGSMYVYLQSKGYLEGNEEISFFQGDLMKLPSEIVVKQSNGTIWVGGKAKIIRELEI